jgi:hypothetical protein
LLLGKQRSGGGSRFEAKPGKQFLRHSEKKKDKKRLVEWLKV